MCGTISMCIEIANKYDSMCDDRVMGTNEFMSGFTYMALLCTLIVFFLTIKICNQFVFIS